MQPFVDKQPRYRCAMCHATVFVDRGEVRRTCDHAESAVIADMVAHATGSATVAG